MIQTFKYIIALFLVFLYLNCSASNLNTFYVSTSGNDNNIGTINQPFKSIQGALKKIGELRSFGKLTGDVKIIVKNGEYRLEAPVLITTKEWDGKNLLSIEGENNKLPVLSGGIKLKKFEKINDNLWKIDLTSVIDENLGIQIQQLYVNSKRALRARTPNLGNFYKTTRTEQKSSPGLGNRVSQVVSLTNEQNTVLNSAASDLGNIVVSFNHKWLRTRGYVTGISKQNKYFTFNSIPLSEVISLSAASQFYFENSRSFLDEPGEWVIDKKGTLFYIPRKGEEINTSVAEIPILNELLIIKGSQNKAVNNIIIENISFQLTKLTLPPQGQLYHQAAFDTGATIMVSYATNITFKNCEITNISNNAVWFHRGCANNKLINSYIHNLGVGGVKVGIPEKSIVNLDRTSNIVIDNNIIRTGGQEISNGVGILIFNSGNNTISHNDISDFKYSGISVGWTWGYSPNQALNNKINNNHIHHIGWAELSDLGGIYILGPSQNTEIENNVISNIFSYDYKGWGIYLDEGSSHIVVQNNLVYNCKSSGFHQHYGRDNVIKNNIFANQLLSQLEISKKETHNSFYFTNNIVYFKRGVLSHNSGWRSANFIANNNLFWDSRKNIRFYNMDFEEWKKTTQKDENSVIADPLFADPDNDDFRFKSRQNIEKINFIPFDYSKAGVYGNIEWKRKAKLDPEIIKAFNFSVERRMKEEGLSK